MSEAKTDVRVVGVDKEGNHTSLPELNEVAFDPTQATLDLTKDEKRRTTSLLLAIQAYDKLIIKDAEMYIAISRDSGRDPEMKIRPATVHAIVEMAVNFDRFIRGDLDHLGIIQDDAHGMDEGAAQAGNRQTD